MPKLLSRLKEFGSYSGYKLNLHKTQTLTFNYEPQENIYKICQFKWKGNTIKYLGVQIPKEISAIYDHNYIPITADIKADLNRWSLLPMNMYNRIDVIKMNILPRLLFLFQSLPVEVPLKQFSDWNRTISSFIWGKQKPRIKFQTLQLPKDKGGMALPCLEDYYRAAQLRSLVCWCDPVCDAKWKDLEKNQISIPLQSILGEKTLLEKLLKKLNNWMAVPLKIWHKLLKDKEFERSARILRWVKYDTEFAPAGLDGRFKHWTNSGITSYCIISSTDGLHTFKKLIDTYNLGKEDFFRYLQLRHHFDKHIKTTEEKGRDLIRVFVDAYKGNTNRKLISRLYSYLQLDRGLSTMYVKKRWEKEANIEISEDDWLNICRTQSTTSSSGLWREFTWKNTLRFFITPNIKKSHRVTILNMVSVGECVVICLLVTFISFGNALLFLCIG